ncbi:TetR/AcrR family transcriptional regulator [Sphingorhabdus sp.]|jgi:AcrR family transcriptional regulator|uniref:TetR/AcrR family transcriptional regulator n=2 Tax=Sphingorhabdus sp. TaxID=1902408 RepID=UPI003BAFD87E|nr:TetR/AcrR family transcriptional regulator [Sphingomonadales bacterium]MBL0022594.1 TetR/AcrR family transcriptional regulator [Sphingomonadales bacterium]
MVAGRGIAATMTGEDKAPRTERGRRTLRALLDAAAAEFGEKGFHESSVVSITSRAGVALGSFYTYFDSKESLFRALVNHMSGQVRDYVAPVLPGKGDQIDAEGRALSAFLSFARKNKEIYRIIDEAEFVAPDAWNAHYGTTVERIFERLKSAESRGEIGGPVDEAHAWAIMGMNVFLGLRYGVLGEERPVDEVAAIVNGLLRNGLQA